MKILIVKSIPFCFIGWMQLNGRQQIIEKYESPKLADVACDLIDIFDANL